MPGSCPGWAPQAGAQAGRQPQQGLARLTRHHHVPFCGARRRVRARTRSYTTVIDVEGACMPTRGASAAETSRQPLFRRCFFCKAVPSATRRVAQCRGPQRVILLFSSSHIVGLHIASSPFRPTSSTLQHGAHPASGRGCPAVCRPPDAQTGSSRGTHRHRGVITCIAVKLGLG